MENIPNCLLREELGKIVFFQYFAFSKCQAHESEENPSESKKKWEKEGKEKPSSEEKEEQKADKPKKKKKDDSSKCPSIQIPMEEALAKKRNYEEMPDQYYPKWVEAFWGKWWEDKKLFNTKGEDAMKVPYEKKFTIVLPPPNITGNLHIGHALTVGIEDCLIRWKRMQGYYVCYSPGTDHAGIGTQVRINVN